MSEKNNEEIQIDTYKLEAEHQVANQLVEANMAVFEEERQELKEKEQAERETLIAEASRLTGRVEAFSFISKVADTSTFITLKNIKEKHIYKEVPNIKTWEDYCISIGYTRRYVDEQIDNISTLGDNFLEVSRQFGVSYKDLRELRKQVKTGNLEIKAEEVVIDGEVIPLDEKDILKDALTELVSKNKEEISKLKAENKAKEKMVQTYAEAKEKKEQELKQAKVERDALKEKLNGLYHGRLGRVAEDDREDFQDITNLELEANKLISSAALLFEKDYSTFNANMFCAVISKLMVAIDDIRQKAGIKYKYNFDGGILSNEEFNNLGNGETPLDFLGE